MINIENFINSLKITWIRRLIQSENSPIKELFETTITSVNNLFVLGYQYIELKLKNIQNQFWYDTLSSWIYMCKKIKIKDYSELYRLPIWNNPLISTYPLFLPELYRKGINLVGDLLNDNGEIITKEDLLLKTGLTTINQLNYLRLKTCIKSLLKDTQFQPCVIYKPLSPLLLSITTKNKKGSKDFYNILEDKQEINTYNKWEDKLNRQISTDTWRLVYKSCFQTIKDNYLIYLQFKIISGILGTRSLLYKISITDNYNCPFCKEHEETIQHLFYECDQILLLWQLLYEWIFNKTKIRINLDKPSILLGYIQPYPNPIPINTINMITKSYIFYCSKNNLRLNIYHLQTRIKTAYNMVEFISIKNNKLNNFNRIWDQYKPLFN